MPSPSNCRIRLATADDAPVLATLRHQFRAALDPVAETAEQFIRRCESWMRQRLSQGGPWRCWVGEEATRVVGMVWLMTIEKLPNPVAEPERHGYLSSLYVLPELRSQGLGSELLSACLGACDAQQYDAVFLWPTARSRSLYLRHGFAVREDLLERRVIQLPAHAGPG